MIIALYGPSLELPGEEVGYSFQLEDSSAVSFLTGPHNEYIIFRFGFPDSIYLEFPEEASSDSWGCFLIDSYSRHGGEQNDGMSVNTISFAVNDSHIEVYDDYYSVGPEYTTGIRITEENSVIFQKQGVFASRTGSLVLFLNIFQSLE